MLSSHVNMSQAISIDTEKIKNAVRLELPVSITTCAFPRKVSMYVDIILTNFLQELHHPEMQEFLSYTINELATNAKKANTKRVYFADKGLDINNDADYRAGMRDFKTGSVENAQRYLQMQKETGLCIKVVMRYGSGNFLIEVRNNSEITKIEFKRVFDKVARSRKYTALEDVLPESFDDDEGAGLGLIISLLMLRKIGVPEENFTVQTENGETIMRVVVPILEKGSALVSTFSKQVADYIENVPNFPDNIMRIEQLLNDPEVDMLDIATNIASDVGLSTDLLRLVNSASFGLKQKVVSIPLAVNLVGTRGIRNLLYSVGVMNIFKADEDDGGKQSELWALSHKAAFYSSWIAHNRVRKASLNDVAHVCGLLHSLGKIVLSFAYPDPSLQDKILKLKETCNIPDNIFGVLTSEVNHPEIGAALAERWDFPPAIVNAIRYQHDYESAPEEFRLVAALVSLVDIILHYQAGDVEFSQIKPDLLKLFSISGEDDFKSLCDRLSVEFEASVKAARDAAAAEEAEAAKNAGDGAS